MRVLLLLISAVVLAACERQPAVGVNGELLVGKNVADGEVAAFLGVPFAEPPVGELRWRAPQPLETKLERRDVTEFAAACMQTMRILDWYRSMAETFGASGDYYDDLEISEDCLYLNIWTPTVDTTARLPVMVWVHGGSNKSGWSYEPNYHGHELAKKGVVVVSIAYRHGAFGFLSHPAFGPNDAVANFGLWDIVASLHWIQENVARFGGDPDRVTLFGESSGAENILALMFAAPAEGLFHRAILESTAGYGIDSSPLIAEQARGTRLASILGFTDDDALAQLKQIPADELLSVYESTFADYYHSPVIDGQLLTESTWENIQAGRFSGHQLIIGTNADESPDRQAAATDFLCPSQETAAGMAGSSGNAWMYFFTRVRDGAGGKKVGAFHGAEYSYAFGVHDAYMRTTDADVSLTNAMMSYWTQFAATGDPNSAATPNWPRFRAPHFQVQDFGSEVATIPAPEPELCALFRAANDGRN